MHSSADSLVNMLTKIIPSWWWRIKMMRAYAAGDYPYAIEAARQVLSKNKVGISALWTIADSYRLQKKYDEAIKFAKKAVALDPRHPDVLQLLSELYFEIGDYRSTYEYVCGTIIILEEIDSVLGGTINAISRSISSTSAKPGRVNTFHDKLHDERARAEEWVKWAVQFKKWYENSERPSQQY